MIFQGLYEMRNKALIVLLQSDLSNYSLADIY